MKTFEEKWCNDKRKLQVYPSKEGIKLTLVTRDSLVTFILDPGDVGDLAAAIWECSPKGVRSMETLNEKSDPGANTAGSSQTKESQADYLKETTPEGRGPIEKADSADQG